MADLQISQLPELLEADLAAGDELAVVDGSASETKRITAKALVEKGVALIDAGSIPGSALASFGTGTVTTASLAANAITAAKIANATITATQIADQTITGGKIADNTVTATQIAANAIGASELADDAVDTNAILDSAVTNQKIADGTIAYAKLNLVDGDIAGAKIANNSITSGQIAADAVGASELANDAVDTTAIANVAVTGSKIASNAITNGKITNATITGAKLVDNTITSTQIAADAITASELADDAVDTNAILDDAVTAAKLAAGAVDTTALAASAVTGAKIAGSTITAANILGGTITATELAANSVGASEIAANAVGASELADDAVDTAAIVNSAVTNAKIADGTITYAKLNLADGDIPSAKIAAGAIGNTQIAANAVGATELANDAVDTAAIQNLAVTGAKIAAATITGAKIAATTIEAGNIVANTITASEIAPNAIGASELADDAVDTAAIANAAVTGAKIANSTITAAKLSLSDGDIAGAKISDNSLTATQIAANAIGASELADNAVDTNAIADDAVTGAKIAAATIEGANIATGTITATQLAADSVGASEIAANAVGSSELADNAVDTAAINNLAVTGAKIAASTITAAKLNLSAGDIDGTKIANDSITASQIAANAVGSSELANNAVDTAAIAASAVTSAKIAANAVTATELADNSVDTAAIADGAVTAAKLSGTLGTGTISDDAVTTSKIVDDAVTSAKLAANAVDATALANNAVDAGAISAGAVTEAKIGTSAVTTTKLAANAVTNAKITDGTITAAKLATGNLDRSLNVTAGNLGINNVITAGTSAGISFNAQGLITGTAALAASDLPVATTTNLGGVSIPSAGGLTVTGTGALSIAATTTGATATKVTFNNFGQITGTGTLAASDLPVATASSVGAVSVPTGGPLSIDSNGAITVLDSGVTAGIGVKVTVDAKGRVTNLAALSASDLPNHSAALITSGNIDAARISNDSISGAKLANASTTLFGSVAQTGFPTSDFTGQFFFDSVSEDLYIYDGNAYQPVTTLTKGSLVFGGTFNAATSQIASVTTAGAAAGLAVGSNLPTPSSATDGLYVVVENAGTPSAPAPVVTLAPPDYVLGVTNTSGSSWEEIDLSQTVAGQVASNITFTPYGQLSSTNVQDALQELETEKLGLSGGTVTGAVLIGNTGSLVFEGSTVDAYETTLTVTDPTTSDKVLTLPDITGTLITDSDTGTVTSTMLANGTIVNADINSSAAIALDKLENITAAQIIVGNGSNVPTAVAVTGDIAITNAGVTSIAAGVIVDSDISNSAAITGSKVTTGTTSAVGVLQLTDSATSTSATTAATPAAVKIAKDAADAAATTANAALPTTGGTLTGNLILDNAKELRLSEADSDGAHFTGFKAQAQSADITYTLPATAPTTGQVLKAGSTATTLEWATDTTNTAAADLTGTTLASGVTASSLTSVGSLTALTAGGLVYPTSDGSANQYLKTDGSGNLSFGTVDLTNLNASNLTSGTVPTARLGTGTAGSTNFLRGDGSWQTIDLSSKASLTGATFTGNISLNAQSDLRFADSDSSHYVALQSPASVASSFTLTLPATDAAVSGYVLASDGAGTLSWVDPGSTSSPTFTGDVSLTNDGALVGFSNLNATYTGNAKTLTVTVASKTGAHRYNGSGSGSGYKIDGKESPFLTLTPGRTYKFDQADSSNSGHPLRFYLEADKTTAYTTGVTTSGTAGSSGAYTQIVVSDTTPQILHYQCSAHGLMGNSVQTNSNNAKTLDGDDKSKFVRTDNSSSMAGQLTMTMGGAFPLKINNNNDAKIVLEGTNNPYIQLREGSTNKAEVAWDANGYLKLNNAEDGSQLRIKDALDFSLDGTTFYSILHTNNLSSITSVGTLTSLDVTNNVVIGGDLTVNGTTTSLSSTILEVEDKNIELGKVTSPTDSTADGGGLTLKGTSDKTWNWVNSTDAWTSSEHIDLASGKTLKIAGTLVLDATNYTGNAATATNIGASTAQLNIPAGTTAQRPGSPANGMFRYNSTTNEFEGYADGAWGSIGGSGVILIDGGNFDNGSSTVGTANVFDGGDFGS